MGSLPPELTLDFTPSYVPKTISDILKEVSLISNVSDKVSKLDGFVNGLQEEMKKIDAFKRELPLCMLLLNDAILLLKSESMQCAAVNNQPVLEEFIPMKKNSDHDNDDDDDDDDKQDGSLKKEKDSKDKKNWMSSVQLWNTNNHPFTDNIFETKQNLQLESKTTKKGNHHQYANDDTFPAYKSRSAARAFMPFRTYSGVSRKENNNNSEELPLPGLSLLTPGIKNLREESSSAGSRANCSRAVSSSPPNPQSNLRNGPLPQQQNARKQRRCWSPELHRRFVSALQQLGGSQAATPKQIRELMQVDGLTNDEVKSHLQKYRLHTRRIPSATAVPANQSVVVLGGGLRMCGDQCGDDSKATGSQSGSPQGPLQLAGNTGGTSTTGGDSMEDDEDAKSEGYSWKSHSQIRKSCCIE